MSGNKIVYIVDDAQFTLDDIKCVIPDAWREPEQHAYIKEDGSMVSQLPVGSWTVCSLYDAVVVSSVVNGGSE